MLGAFSIEGPSSTALVLLWAFYILMGIGFLGLIFSVIHTLRRRP